jgi:electron transfer flavoprotein alpha subunit
MIRILVIAEHLNKQIAPSTLAVLGAAKLIGGEIDILLYGSELNETAANAANIAGVAKVLVTHAEHDYLQGDVLVEILKPIVMNYTHILMSAGSVGKDVMPYAAASFDMQQISEITKILSTNSFVRPIYAGNAYETVQSHEKLNFITVRSTNFAKVEDHGGSAEIIQLAPPAAKSKITVEEMRNSGGERPDLGAARVVVSGGRGVGSKENFALIEQLADKLNAAIGASRAAVDAGYVPNDYQVGQTGKVVAPDLYIAVGISGAIQHLAGMKDSKVIVAINKDENAPIFNVADYGLVGDLFQIVPELIQKN